MYVEKLEENLQKPLKIKETTEEVKLTKAQQRLIVDNYVKILETMFDEVNVAIPIVGFWIHRREKAFIRRKLDHVRNLQSKLKN